MKNLLEICSKISQADKIADAKMIELPTWRRSGIPRPFQGWKPWNYGYKEKILRADIWLVVHTLQLLYRPNPKLDD
jgi:hypothetical protein